MAKISKSIRAAEDVYAYIVRYKGEGFNEKFENIIRYAMESEKKREERIKDLDKQIKDKEKQVQSLQSDISKLQTIKYRVDEILRSCSSIETQLDIKLETVSQKSSSWKIS